MALLVALEGLGVVELVALLGTSVEFDGVDEVGKSVVKLGVVDSEEVEPGLVEISLVELLENSVVEDSVVGAKVDVDSIVTVDCSAGCVGEGLEGSLVGGFVIVEEPFDGVVPDVSLDQARLGLIGC